MQDLKTVRPLERLLLKPKISSENSGTTYIETGMSQSVKSPYGLMVPECKKKIVILAARAQTTFSYLLLFRFAVSNQLL